MLQKIDSLGLETQTDTSSTPANLVENMVAKMARNEREDIGSVSFSTLKY
jgi:hypothetical protein